MLAAALKAEVAAYVAQLADQVDELGIGWWSATAITASGRFCLRRAR